jgi:mannose-6-phosphate isomerase-like protein (cupin superfamily)
MLAFDVRQVLEGFGQDHVYLEPLVTDSLSVGIAVWKAGTADHQRPHAEDEVYCVVAGRGRIQVGREGDAEGLQERAVEPGSVVFVAAGVPHRFHSIEEDLRVVVFWVPPHRGQETQRRPPSEIPKP